MNVVLYFGSFNPVHLGHMAVAEYVLSRGLCDEIWFVVSPRNPLKNSESLAGEQDRLRMTQLAVAESEYPDRMRVCNIEFGLPRPSYTIDTLRVLTAKYPDYSFSLLAGADIADQIEHWKEWHTLLADYRVYLYPRSGYGCSGDAKRFTILTGAPLFDFSSTDVRKALAEGIDTSGMLPRGVNDYIKKHGLWATTKN